MENTALLMVPRYFEPLHIVIREELQNALPRTRMRQESLQYSTLMTLSISYLRTLKQSLLPRCSSSKQKACTVPLHFDKNVESKIPNSYRKS